MLRGESAKEESAKLPPWEADKWRDLAQNPLIGPVARDRPGGVIGDPQVILPGELDDEWHLFCTGRGHFYRFDSPDGITWRLVYDRFWNSGPACVTSDGREWIVFYSRHDWPDSPDSIICARRSQDLVNWSDPVELLAPELDWEREGPATQVRNPNLVILPDGRFRLYYSGGTVWMHDMGFEEPKYIGFAEAENPWGPYVKRRDPVRGPSPSDPYRNHGAGAIKVFRYGGCFLGMTNGIYIDAEGHTRSAISVSISNDGIEWRDAPYNPIVRPGGEGWKRALIYQLDLRWYGNKLWLFYNARGGWAGAEEWIGCSILDWSGPAPEKMWVLPAEAGRGRDPGGGE